jgi:AcrR family transcriptional regulator
MPEEKNKKQIIYEAAARLFRDKGYSATSMRDLAGAVNLKASSLYNHIKSKEEILQGICFENARRFLVGMKEVEAMPGSTPEKVRALIHLHISIATDDVTSVTAFNDEWRHLSEPMLQEFLQLRKDYEQRFKKIIEQGIAEGDFRALDPSILLYTLFSSIRWVYDWYKPERSVDQEKLESEISEFLMKGMLNG